ncbi:MAG: EamA/RhaT family transporter, partial [Betaproteobacteria bacterium]|nr:EamA/RhaT family transporter [Betaproteobacteria bacterium]
MSIEPWYWIAFTVTAAAAQVGRNISLRSLSEAIGTVGATQVRFLYGLPFGLIFATLVLLAQGQGLP